MINVIVIIISIICATISLICASITYLNRQKIEEDKKEMFSAVQNSVNAVDSLTLDVENLRQKSPHMPTAQEIDQIINEE